MPNIPGPTGAPGPDGGTPPGFPPVPTEGDPATLSVEKSWHNLMIRLAYTSPRTIQKGAKHLDAVDRITGMSSR